MDNVIYTAAFVSERTMRQLQYIAAKHGVRLPKTPDRPHITLEFRPEKDHVRKELFGKKIFCHLTGYGNNGKNEGFYISVDGGDKELFKLFARLDAPHITMSFAEDAKPVDTQHWTSCSLLQWISSNLRLSTMRSAAKAD